MTRVKAVRLSGLAFAAIVLSSCSVVMSPFKDEVRDMERRNLRTAAWSLKAEPEAMRIQTKFTARAMIPVAHISMHTSDRTISGIRGAGILEGNGGVVDFWLSPTESTQDISVDHVDVSLILYIRRQSTDGDDLATLFRGDLPLYEQSAIKIEEFEPTAPDVFLAWAPKDVFPSASEPTKEMPTIVTAATFEVHTY